MKHLELQGLMENLAPTIGAFVSRATAMAIAPLRAENERLSTSLASVEQRCNDIFEARAQDRVVFITLVREEIAKVELPAVKEIDPAEIERVVSEKVEKAVSALPMPENGRDAEPINLDEVAQRAAKLVPVPADGRDATPEDIKSAVLDVVADILPGEVLAAVEKIEKPRDGKDADPELMRSMIVAEVSKIEPAKDGKDGEPGQSVDMTAISTIVEQCVESTALRMMPADGKDGAPGVDGKSITIDEMRPLLVELVAALPAPINVVNGRDSDPELIRSIVIEEVSKIELPKDGKDGTSVAIEDLAQVIAAEVEKSVGAIAPPQDGAPGVDGKSVTVDEVRPMLEQMVAALPPARDGKDADAIEIATLIFDDVVKSIPVPADGKSVTIDEVRPMIEELIAALPKPRDGKDADSVEIASLIIEDVAKLIPAPADGKSVSVEDVRPLLAEMVAALPLPQNGKDADPAEVAALIVDDVARLIPRPADGKSVTLEQVVPLVEEAAAKQLPASFLINEEGHLVSVYRSGDTRSVGKVRGDNGLRGASVMDGHVDEDGTLILRMSDGRTLQTGIVRGVPGKSGEDGKKGERGRDAIEIQILPGVEESKSYVENTCALWRGGVIRAERQTDPIIDGDIAAAGWKAVMRGIAEERESESDEGRYIERTTIYTDGTEFSRRIKTVTPIYQDIWKEGASYLKGDSVTWAGSCFIARRDTSDKPESTDAWRLSTKRGRDGKDGKIKMITPPIVKIDPDKR